MASFSIQWHEEGLRNQTLYHQQLINAMNRAIECVNRSQERIDYKTRQIARAKKLGKTSFDPERFKAD